MYIGHKCKQTRYFTLKPIYVHCPRLLKPRTKILNTKSKFNVVLKKKDLQPLRYLYLFI